MYGLLSKSLSRFSCYAYSVHPFVNCDTCRAAYRHWACSMRFPVCGGGAAGQNYTRCPGGRRLRDGTVVPLGRGEPPPPPTQRAACSNAESCCRDGRRKICLSICQDVVRKCPSFVAFTCPQGETPEYSADRHCNKLNYTYISRAWACSSEEPWPATFPLRKAAVSGC